MLTVTPSAAARVKEIGRRPEYAKFARPGLRVKVVGGGCAGFSYEVEFVDGPRDGDLVVGTAGAARLKAPFQRGLFLVPHPQRRPHRDALVRMGHRN